jgi:hypothetical protein
MNPLMDYNILECTDMAEFSVECTTVLFHDPFQEALILKEVLYVPENQSTSSKEPKEYTTETDRFIVGGERRHTQGCYSPRSPSNPTHQPWKLELHQNHAIANFSMQLEVEVDDFRGWERLDTAHNTQRSWHDASLLVPFNLYCGESADSTCPPTTHVLNFTGDQKHLHLLLSPGFIPSESLQMEEMREVFGTSEVQNAAFILESSVCSSSSEVNEDHRGVLDESNSTWNLQLETLLLDQVLSAPTEAHNPLPSLDFVMEKGGDQLVQDLAAAEVTDGSPLMQQVIFEGFQRRTGTRKYLSAADLNNSPRQITIMSAQADKPKELNLLDVSAFVFLPVVAICFWMLTFSNDPLPPPTRGCNGASKSCWSVEHNDPFLGLGLIRNVCNLIVVRALSTIVDSIAGSLGLALDSNAHTPIAISPPKLPHIRVKLSSRSLTSDSPQKMKSGQEKNHSGSLSNSKRKAGNSGKRIRTQGISASENYTSSPNEACSESQQMGNTCSGSSTLVGSPRKGTFMLQKSQPFGHPVQQQQHRQSAFMKDKEKRRQQKKKGSSAGCVNHDTSSNPGGSSGGSSPFSPASPRTPASLVLPASPLSPFEVPSGRALLGDPVPAPLAQQPKVATYNKQVTHRSDTMARGNGTGNDSVTTTATRTSESALFSEGIEHKSSSKSKLGIFSHWDKRTTTVVQQHETSRPSLSISASFPAYSARSQETKQNLSVDPALKKSNITIAPSCRAPGAKITKQSLRTHESHVVPHNKTNTNKFATTEGGVHGLGIEDSNLYDIWGEHFGEVGRFTTQQQQNGFAHMEKTSGLNKLLVCRNAGSLFSNPVFESLETSTSSEAGSTHVSAIRLMPQQLASFSVYSEASSLGPVSSSEPIHPLQIAETGVLKTSMPDSSKHCLTTDSIRSGYIAKPTRMPAPYKPPMGWHTPHFMASSS